MELKMLICVSASYFAGLQVSTVLRAFLVVVFLPAKGETGPVDTADRGII